MPDFGHSYVACGDDDSLYLSFALLEFNGARGLGRLEKRREVANVIVDPLHRCRANDGNPLGGSDFLDRTVLKRD